MKHFIKIALVSVFAFVLLFAAGCSKPNASTGENNKSNASSGENKTGNTSPSQKIKIGISVLDITNPFWIQITDEMKKLAEAQGAELTVASANMDINKQINQIENFVSLKVNVIALIPVDPKGVESALKKARDAGIKVISIATKLENADMQILADQYKIGQLNGEYVGKWINTKLGGKTKVALITANRTPDIIKRGNGMEDAIKKVAPNATIIGRQDAKTSSEAMKIAENFLQANPDIKAIATASDNFGIAAVEAVKAAGKASNDFIVTGSDATPEALAKLKEGGIFRFTLSMQGIPNVTIDNAIKLAKGVSVEKNQYLTLTQMVQQELK